MSDKEDYLTAYRVFFENFAATVNPEDQLPVNIAGYTITEAELPGEVLYWTTQYLAEKQCPPTLMTPLLRIILDEVRIASKKQPNDFGYKSDDSVYIALRLMQAVTARVNLVCLRYLDNSRLDSLPPPPPVPQRDMKTVSCATKNSRRVMEDRHVEFGNLDALFGIETTEPTSFYAVYDGHAGSAAATYCAAHLHQYLVESSHYTTNLEKAMREAFIRTDTDFVRKSNQERACGGSTAVVVAVRGRKLLAAWAGDSLALLAKRMRLMQLVRPHKPGREDERDRIEAAGGTVMFWGTWRVNGQLAVSRAIGDAQYKPYVTARPDIAEVDLDGDEDFVVVACDGLWDFVSEDDVALAVYRQVAVDPDDLKAVTKRLVVQAKRQGSADNISIIVVFLKDPRDIAADNCLPMDLGLDNALANSPPFAMETEACKRLDAAAAEAGAGGCTDAVADNGVDNSDSDSEDLGPETAVDADDLDADARLRDAAPPSPPPHAVEPIHVDGALVDNVAESGEESEDEWNYIKGKTDEPPRSDTPCQDNSAWETSSTDMNSSPLNPDAPVFVPGTVAGSDVLLAESPRKPLPMDDIELPDVAQFRTEAVVRPAELLDLDNCDQLNGHHNISMDVVKEHLNGNEKNAMDSLGFGFNVGIEPDKGTDTGLIQDFERIQKDTTDFCNIQVFQTHTETNPFAADGNEELFERLKNKERDPMNMSFYQEKDDDTCERLAPENVDLNAVRLLPDSDDDDLPNGGSDEKENISPEDTDRLTEPNNDILRFDCRTDITNFAHGDSFMDFTNNMQNYTNNQSEPGIPQEVAQTDTPESHKLLFEQIPEIPDGKSSELGFTNEDVEAPSESERETSHDVEMESKLEDCPELSPEQDKIVDYSETELLASPEPRQDNDDEIVSEPALNVDVSFPREAAVSPAPATTPEVAHANVVVDVHQDFDGFEAKDFRGDVEKEGEIQVPEFQFESVFSSEAEAPAFSPSPAAQAESPLPPQPERAQTPVQQEDFLGLSAASPVPTELRVESPLPAEVPLPRESPLPAESPVPAEARPVESSAPTASPLPTELTAPSPLPTELLAASPIPNELTAASPLPTEMLAASPLLNESSAPAECLRPETASPPTASPVPVYVPDEAAPVDMPTPLGVDSSGPAPDIVPEEPSRSDLVTDIDIGIPESRAQEICVPVSSEIQPEDSELAAATPPPTPAAPVSDSPIAGDIAPAAALAATAAIAATAATAAAVSKTKTSASATKKSPAPSKATPKPIARTTPASAKRPAATTPASATKPATGPARTPVSGVKPAPSPAKMTTKTTPVKPTVPPARTAPRAAPVAKASSVTAKAPITRPAKPAAVKEVAAAKSATTMRAAPKPAPARPATAPAKPASAATKPPVSAAAKPAAPAAKPAAAKPAPRPASARPAAPRPKTAPTERKPLLNGDAKPAAAAPAKPAPRPVPITRPAPRPTPRAPVDPAAPAAPLKSAAAATAPKPAPRARPAPAAADKQSKDLANRRITAKAAPPRTSSTKAPVSNKNGPVKSVTRKPIESKKEVEQTNGPSNGLANGAPEPELQLKAPPSPPAESTLLPDVIA